MPKSQVKFSFYFIVLPLLIPGLLVAAWRCLFRNIAEQKNVFVETVIDFEEMRQMSREEGWKLKDLFAAMKENGASSVAISEDTLASLESEGRITVLSAKEIRKLSLDASLQHELPVNQPGSLWIHAEDSTLLDRIEQQLSWKIAASRLNRLHRNFLLVNKSAQGFRERVGLGFSSEYFDMANEAGLGLVVRVFNYPELSASSAARIIASIPSPASVSALLFAEEEMLGNRGDLDGVIDLFNNRSYRIGWIEFNTQEGIERYLKRLSASRPFVRVHSISRKEIDQVYNKTRAVARWVRAVKDRSMKMLYIRCFFQDDKRYIPDLVKFNLDYLSRIEKSLNKAGFKIARSYQERVNEPRHLVGNMSAAEKIAISLALLLGLPLLLKFSFFEELDDRWFLLMAVVSVVGFFLLSNENFIGISGLIGAFAYSSLGVIVACKSLEKEQTLARKLVNYFTILVFPSVIGGILIAGLYSEVEYLLKFAQFRGIKLAFILPVIWVFIWSLKQYGRGVLGMLNRPVTPIMAALAAAVGFAFVVYLLRSGNLTIVKPSAIEDSFRTFLENTLVARPRNKEFLIGYPAAALFIFFYLRRCLVILPLLAVFVQMGQVSVVNTLCHFHSPLYLSLLRIFNGFWLGIVLSVPTIVFAALVWLFMLLGNQNRSRVLLAGYLGFDNFGDELLWQNYFHRLRGRIPDIEIAVLAGDAIDVPQSCQVVRRRNWFEVIENLLSCRALIFPGGGILQASTSLGSLLYYSVLIFIARIGGAKVVMPAQGIGPWGENLQKFPWIFSVLSKLFVSIDYLTVRDVESQNSFCELTQIQPDVTADAAFIGEVGKLNISEAHSDLRLAVVLRSSVSDSEEICRHFLKIAEEVENLKIIPVVFQSGDEVVWQKCGWSDELVKARVGEPVFVDVDLIVSMRLHGCIIATAQAIPWLGIAYDPKVSSFAAACNWKFCFEPDKIDRQLLEQQLNLLASRKVDFAAKLARKANEMTRRAQQDLDAVVEILQSVQV